MLLTKNQAKELTFLGDINEGFRIPDFAHINGSQLEFMGEIGADLYFSNYWYGPKEVAFEFAEQLARHFIREFEIIPHEADTFDFQGMVMLWENGDNTMVGNINLEDDLMLGGSLPFKAPEGMQQVLEDSNDNNPFSMDVSEQLKKEMLPLVASEYQEEYLENI